MKVLIISNNEEKIKLVDSFMKKRNFDVIVYKWMLKAIDNIEEIRPDVIFLSSTEFPRHWKTLASFVQSGIGGENVRLFLYEQSPLSQEEIDKASALGIEACLTSLDEDVLNKYFEKNEDKINDQNFRSAQYIMTSPKDKSLLSGNVININNDDYICSINDLSIFKINMELENVSVSIDSNIHFFSCIVKEINYQESTIILTAQEYYEEK